MMKNLLFLALSLSTAIQLNGQTLLWGGPNDPNSTFAGGLGAWTTAGISSYNSDSTANAVWSYAGNGTSRGAYSQAAGSINSPSKANGALIFDSDYLDNGGTQGNEGHGSAPSPHSGSVTSPNIDCSTFPSVAVSFYQYFQNYLANCDLQVSNDSGATWTTFPINANIRPGTGTARNNRQIIDISNIAANHKNVYLRFVFSGDYYFWVIDDVTLLSLPENDLSLTKVYYAPYSYSQPTSQVCRDRFDFKAKISNLGSNTQSGVLYRVEILGANRSSRVWADSIYLTNNITSNDDNLDVNTPTKFDPSKLTVGKYYIRTTLTYNNNDYNPADNSRIDSFEITPFTFSREPRGKIGNRANGGTAYTVCTHFRTSDCWNSNDKFFAATVEAGIIAGSRAVNKDYSVVLNVAEIKDDVLEDFSNFDITHGLSSASIAVLSDQDLKVKVLPGFNTYNLDLVSAVTNDKLFLKANSRYFVMCTHRTEANADSADTWHYHLCSNEKNYDGHPFAIPVIDNDGNWFESWPDGESPVLRVILNVVTTTDENPLPENVMVVQPNPVKDDVLRLKMNFSSQTKANITIFTLDGRVTDFRSFQQISNGTLEIPVGHLQDGEYFVRVSSEEGTKTAKFIK
ncbi:MAG: T9SS type A sorting domain-containing protein [Saprospiraceae bacterium]